MKELRTEIVLNSTPEKIYQVLTDLDHYKQWNPFIVHSSGEVQVGATLTHTMINGENKMVIKPRVTVAQRNKRFEWLGSAFLGLFKGRHYFILEDLLNGQTKLTHGEQFSGLLSGPILRMIRKDTLKSFQAMNQALKERVEP